MRWCVLALGVAVLAGGCSRAWYRRDADRETYATVGQHMTDPRWVLPRTSIDAPPESRLHDPYDPDHPPLPPDDAAASAYMRPADALLPGHRYIKDGLAPGIEDLGWWTYLPVEPDGTLKLTPDRAIELGLLHSREYQTALEGVYLEALALTLNRFEFDLHWFFRNGTFYDHLGSSSLPNESNTLTTTTTAGFSKTLRSGGELLVNLANSFVWEYTGKDTNTVSSNILVTLFQPLLRQAGRRIRMEDLTQAERDVLYAVRDFERFRKQFSVELTTGPGGYLELLVQMQSIRNQQANLKSLEQIYRLHEALLPLGSVSEIQIDQTLQSYQAGRLQLLRAETALEEALDRYKLNLGLPPTIPVKLDDAQLQLFQLTDPALVTMQDELEKFHTEIRQPDLAPLVDHLRDGYTRLLQFQTRAVQMRGQIDADLARWKEIKPADDESRENLRRENQTQRSLTRQLDAVRSDLDDLQNNITKQRAVVHWFTRFADWEDLQKLIREEIAIVAQLFVIQNQVRVYLIRLAPVKLDVDAAIEYALEERLDLMNRRGLVVDAWRKTYVTANALQSDLNVRVEADIATAADASNPFDFRASANRYRVGFEFDGPLNRQLERNIYRASLVTYQRARREFMASEDSIRQAIRRDLRNLQTERLNFEIVRQSLITAARQVEATRAKLLIAERGQGQDTSTTRDTLDALRTLLESNNALIGSWVSYQNLRIQLLFDLEALELNERGLYRDDQEIDLRRTRPEPVVQPVAEFIGPPQPARP